MSTLSLAAFAEEEEPEPARPSSVTLETELLHVEWLQETPEDLDVAIAQRDFEGAVDLIEKGETDGNVDLIKKDETLSGL